MHLDHDQLNQLLDKLAESDIQEFRLEGDDFRLEVRRNLPVMATATQMVPVAAAPVPAVEIKTQSESSSAAPPAAAGTRSDLVDVTAPMVGTFYRAPAPGEPAFVEIGNRISAGQTFRDGQAAAGGSPGPCPEIIRFIQEILTDDHQCVAVPVCSWFTKPHGCAHRRWRVAQWNDSKLVIHLLQYEQIVWCLYEAEIHVVGLQGCHGRAV